MLKQTFLHINGIGPKVEQLIWEEGVYTWDDMLIKNVSFFTQDRLKEVRERIELSIENFEKNNMEFFKNTIPGKHLWRLYPHYKNSILYMDIESTGIATSMNHVTSIAAYDGGNIFTFVYGQDLEDFPEFIKKYKNKRLFADYLFTFGKNSEIFYKKFLKCNNFINLGSFRNNNVKLKKSSEKKNILFISQFRVDDLEKGDEYNVESEIIKIINIFFVKKKIKLFVATASNSLERYLEEKYFLLSKLPEKHNVRLIRKKNILGNYSLINKFETIVFIDSTLGYEAIARKKKIVAISVRKEKGKIIYPFGFPTIKSNKAFFFTNFDAKKEIFRVLNNVYSLPLKEWLKKYQEKLNALMNFNKDNIRLIKTISKLIN